MRWGKSIVLEKLILWNVVDVYIVSVMWMENNVENL
jgi:hypothetical protein